MLIAKKNNLFFKSGIAIGEKKKTASIIFQKKFHFLYYYTPKSEKNV